MNRYVLGFVFDKYLLRVALIQKAHPEFQAGKLNGIGGKIEEGELPFQAMMREFKEETGKHINGPHWKAFGVIRDRDRTFEIHLFCCINKMEYLKTMTREVVTIVKLQALTGYKLVPMTAYCIHTAETVLDGTGPAFVEILAN